ncbi:hypothetical protein EOA91_30600, partial [Mesorhizobium sp. M1A.F.Ca.IN.022.04.1.1]
ERKTEPQVANSVTLEVTNEGAQKVALARTVGSFATALTSEAALASLVKAVAKEPEEPKFKTVIVSRGTKVEEYKVPSKPAEGDVVPSKEQEQ